MKTNNTDQQLLEQAYQTVHESSGFLSGLITDLMGWVPLSRQTAEGMVNKFEQEIEAKADELTKKIVRQKLPGIKQHVASKEKISYRELSQLLSQALSDR